MSLLDEIKSDVKKSGQNKGKFIYFREGAKTRIRFLQDMNDGMSLTFHDSFQRGINVPCQELFGRTCPHCEDEEIRTRNLYCWSVYDYEAKDVKLFMFAVNNCSPLPQLMSFYETYGTLTDRDYVISVNGKGTSKTYSVVPMDKNKFRNEKAKPYSEKAVLKMVDKAFPDDSSDDSDDDDEYEEKPKKKAKKIPVKKAEEEDNDDDDYDYEDDSDEEEEDLSTKSPKELYKICKAREIDVEPKKSAKYYLNAIKEADEAEEDWADEDEDEWEDE